MRVGTQRIAHLRSQPKTELTAVTQRFLPHLVRKYWGLDKLATWAYSKPIGERSELIS
jgi:bacterioferritin (cytochrome b1)